MVSALKIVDEAPDFKNRSALTIFPGDYEMRNGNKARVMRRMDLDYKDGMTGKPAKYPIWLGHCLCCHSPMSWNVNGCYAAVGKHEMDLLRRIA